MNAITLQLLSHWGIKRRPLFLIGSGLLGGGKRDLPVLLITSFHRLIAASHTIIILRRFYIWHSHSVCYSLCLSVCLSLSWYSGLEKSPLKQVI